MTRSLPSVVALAVLSTGRPVSLSSPAWQSLRTRTVKVPAVAVRPGTGESALPSTAPWLQVAPARYVLQVVKFVAR